MTIEEWNINQEEGEELIIEIFKEILRIKDYEVSEDFLCKSMSKFANYNNVQLRKNDKVRNLNTFMKNIFALAAKLYKATCKSNTTYEQLVKNKKLLLDHTLK